MAPDGRVISSTVPRRVSCLSLSRVISAGSLAQSHPRNRSPGPDPTQVEGRLLGLLRHRRSQHGPTEAINEHYRTRQTHRQRLPQPHQLPTPNAPHHRRPRRLHPHSTLKSPFICIWALLSSANDKHSSVAEHREGQPGNTAFSALNTPGYAGIGTSKGMAERQIVSLERQLLGRQRIELLH